MSAPNDADRLTRELETSRMAREGVLSNDLARIRRQYPDAPDITFAFVAVWAVNTLLYAAPDECARHIRIHNCL